MRKALTGLSVLVTVVVLATAAVPGPEVASRDVGLQVGPHQHRQGDPALIAEPREGLKIGPHQHRNGEQALIAEPREGLKIGPHQHRNGEQAHADEEVVVRSVEVEEQVQIVDISIAPCNLVIGEQGEWVTVHADIPYSLVDTNSLEMAGLQPVSVFADARGDLVAKFDQLLIQAIVSPPDAEFTLTGNTKMGQAFEGTATIQVQETGKQ
jgi:hypothetical protein